MGPAGFEPTTSGLSAEITSALRQIISSGWYPGPCSPPIRVFSAYCRRRPWQISALLHYFYLMNTCCIGRAIFSFSCLHNHAVCANFLVKIVSFLVCIRNLFSACLISSRFLVSIWETNFFFIIFSPCLSGISFNKSNTSFLRLILNLHIPPR